MKIPFLTIFKSKIQRQIDSFFDAKDKLEAVKYKYKKDCEAYENSAVAVLTSEKELSDKMADLKSKTSVSKNTYEKLIVSGDMVKAKAAFINYKSLEDAYNTVSNAHANVLEQCTAIKKTIEQMDVNETILDARISSLEVKIDALNICRKNHAGLDTINFDCNAVLEDIEKEINSERYRVESRQEVNQLRHPKATEVSILSSSNYDEEFEAEVARLK